MYKAILFPLVLVLMLAATPALAADVMLLNTNTGQLSQLQTALNAHPGIDSVELFDGTGGTPTAGDLADIDAVFVSSNHNWDDNEAVGDLLADFVDGGGGVVLDLGGISSGALYGVDGRLMDDGYIPLDASNDINTPNDLGDFDADHPIMDGVSTASSEFYGEVDMDEDAYLVASFAPPRKLAGEEMVATMGSVAAINCFLGDNSPMGGDGYAMAANALYWSYAAAQTPAVTSVDPDSGTNDGVASVEISGDFFMYNDTEVKLSGPNKAEIPATNIVLTGYETIACDFDLDGADPGEYHIVVTTGGGEGTLDDGFTVEEEGDDDTGDDDDDITDDDITDDDIADDDAINDDDDDDDDGCGC